MNSIPKISVVTPSYGQGQFIEETLRSVIDQRYPNVEHIVIDGTSKDETVSILQRLESHLTYWVSEPDKGQTNAINKGLSRVTGDLVLILNSDDTLLPGAFDYVARQFMETPSMRWMTAPSLMFGPGADEDVTLMQIPSSRAEWFVKWGISHPSTYVRREVIEKHGPYDETLYFGMDYEYWLRLVFGGETCHTRPRLLSSFRLHEDCKSVKDGDRRAADQKALFAKYSPMLSESERRGLPERIAKMRASEEAWNCLWPLRRGDQAGAMKALESAVAANPLIKKTKAYYTTLLRIKLNRPS